LGYTALCGCGSCGNILCFLTMVVVGLLSCVGVVVMGLYCVVWQWKMWGYIVLSGCGTWGVIMCFVAVAVVVI